MRIGACAWVRLHGWCAWHRHGACASAHGAACERALMLRARCPLHMRTCRLVARVPHALGRCVHGACMAVGGQGARHWHQSQVLELRASPGSASMTLGAQPDATAAPAAAAPAAGKPGRHAPVSCSCAWARAARARRPAVCTPSMTWSVRVQGRDRPVCAGREGCAPWRAPMRPSSFSAHACPCVNAHAPTPPQPR